MNYICLFFPSIISLKIYMSRNSISDLSRLQQLIWMIASFAVYVVVNNLFIMTLCNYVLGLRGITESDFSSFQFFIKYLLLEMVIAILLPFIHEILVRHFSISVEITERNDK